MLIESSPGSDWGHAQKFVGAGCERAPGQRRWRRFRRHQLSKIGRSLHLHPGSGAWSGVWWWNWCDRCSGHQSGYPSHHPQAVWWNLSGVGEIATKKVKQRPKPSVVSPPGTKWGQRVQFDQRDQAQRPTIIRRQGAENMTEGFHRPVAVKDIWQQFNHKE